MNTLTIYLAMPLIHIAALLLGRRRSRKLETLTFYSGIVGVASIFIAMHLALRELGFAGAQQSLQVSPGLVAIVVAGIFLFTSLLGSVALLFRRRTPNKSFKPNPLRGSA